MNKTKDMYKCLISLINKEMQIKIKYKFYTHNNEKFDNTQCGGGV